MMMMRLSSLSVAQDTAWPGVSMGATQSTDRVISAQSDELVWTVIRSISDDHEQISVFEHEIRHLADPATVAAANARHVRVFI